MAATAKKPLKGILKNSQAALPPSGRHDDSATEIALRHAAIIQDRKGFEAAITDAIIRLTELPVARDPPYSSSNPAPSDVAEFKSLVRMFRLTDYDDLIEERNTCDLCGYTLCSNRRKKFEGNGTWKLINVGKANFGIVPKKELENWCSQQCARRALYIKVQLSETAAWERSGIPDIEIDLLEDERQEDRAADTTPEAQLARDLAKLKLDDERKQARDAADLALERGNGRKGGRQPQVEIDIVENTAPAPPTEPTLPGGSEDRDVHMVLEGHRTKFQ